MRFAYADPPYLGWAKSFYGDLHKDAAEYDNAESHVQLIQRLCDEYQDGWALSLSSPTLALYLTHCPQDVRIAAWVKTMHQIRPNCTVQYAWEPVIFRGGRQEKGRKPMVRDWLRCHMGIGQGLRGAKPAEFNRWVLDLLNFRPDEDTIDDLFPGTGGLSHAVAQGVLL